MPDDELFKLAASETSLRKTWQPAAGAYDEADLVRSGEFVRNFVGQWLQARDIQTVIINARAVISRDEVPDLEKPISGRARFRELNSKLSPDSLTEAEKKSWQRQVRDSSLAASAVLPNSS